MARSDFGNYVVVFLAGILIGAGMLAMLLTAPASAPTSTASALSQRSANANIVAVSAETNRGVMGITTVEIVPGQGRLLISTNPFIEPDTQQSVAIAKAVAENYTGVSLSRNDIIVSFGLLGDGGRSVQLVGGPSAGAALTLATIAAMLNTTLKPNVAITGQILPDGSIGSVGGIIEKATAAGEAGMKLFIVPAGEANVTYYEKTTEHSSSNGFTITRISYVSQTITLDNYTQQWNMTSVEAGDISEAARYAIANLTIGQ